MTRTDEPTSAGSATHPEHAETAAAFFVASPQQSMLERGARIGRYVVLDLLGSGGMGVVYAAWDPELDRKVALKLLRAELSAESQASDGSARLLREAQAMARLSHPNVITVHDVGALAGQVFVAMEFVDGGTLRQWSERAPRTWREVLDVYTKAGAGLAAAHAAGLVHRDFKPDNVLIGNDGRVRVVDFGLAREARAANDPRSPILEFGDTSDGRRPDLGVPLTQTGAFMGTPVYMAPEQHLRGHVDARTDQWSFCVALYEALYGHRPFSAQGETTLGLVVSRGEVPPAPANSAVPEWVRRVVLRGLRPAADARYPDVDALLADLARDPTVARRKWLWRAGAVSVAALAIVLLVVLRADPAAVCQGGERKLGGIWDPPRRAALERTFLLTGAAYAETAATGAARILDGYAADWVKMRREACEATRVHGEQSEQLLDLRIHCLDQRLRDLSALVDVFTAADAKVVRNAVLAAEGLSNLSSCADAAMLSALVPPPSDALTRAKVESGEAKVAAVKANLAAGKVKEALPLAEGALAAAKATGYRPLEAQALYQLGVVLTRSARHKDAERSLTGAFAAALAGKDDRTATLAASRLIAVLGYKLARHDDAERWSSIAKGFVERLGDDADLRANLEAQLGLVALERGRYTEMLGHQRRAVSSYERAHGKGGPGAAVHYSNLGLGYYRTGDLENALVELRRALGESERVLGADHPEVARYRNNLAIVLSDRGDYEEALALHRLTLATYTKVFGADHPNTGDSHTNIGIPLIELRRYPEAILHHRRAMAIFERANGAAHPSVAIAANNLGNALEASGKAKEALVPLERARGICVKAHGEAHPECANVYVNIAQALRSLGRVDEALAQLRKTLVLREKAHGKEHPDVAESCLLLGETQLLRAEAAHTPLPPGVVGELERAEKILDASKGFPIVLARTRFALAQALVLAGPTAAAVQRARSLATAALDTWRKLGAARAPERERATRWLAQVGAGAR